MTIRLYMLLIVFSFITRTAIAQTPTPEEKAKYIGYLDSAYTPLVQEALWEIREHQITEAILALERNIWRQEAYQQLWFLKVMWKLHSPNTLAFARAFIDTTDTFRFKNTSSFTDSLEAKVDATEILFDLGDYSTVPYVFEILKRDSTSSYTSAVCLLAPITSKVPEYAEKAKTELIRIALHDVREKMRWIATSDLVELYGSQVNDVLLQVAVNDPQMDNRFSALQKLIALGYPEIKNLLYDRLYKESSTYRSVIADTLLIRYGTPQDYHVVKEYLTWEPDSLDKPWKGYLLRTLKPHVPSLSTSVLTLLDSLISYKNQCATYGWLGDQNFVTELNNYLAIALNNLNTGNQIACARQIKIFQQTVDQVYHNSSNKKFVTIEGWKFLYYNAQYILDRLPQIPPSGCNVKLVSSANTKLTGGALQYYEGSWKDAVNNNDGTFFVNTTKTTLSLRMTYEYGTQTKSNVTVGSDTVAFQTVNAQIQLQNSSGALKDTGSVQYYAGAWRILGTTINGTATKELLPTNYSFRMTYAYASKDKQQDISTNPTVVFQTVNAVIQLQNSQGSLIDQGTVQYYSGAWRNLGTTSNGVANKELLPNNYSFRMTYAYASKDKQQDLSTNPTVVFQTVNATVQLKNSLGNLMPAPLGDQGTVQYYSGAWRTFGTTMSGTASKELLPNTYSFRMTYEYVSLDKAQDISSNNTVSFSTVLCTIRVKNSQNQLVNNAMASYYSGAWRQMGNTVNGEITKELLPVNLSFRVKLGTQQKDKQQNLSTSTVVEFGIQ